MVIPVEDERIINIEVKLAHQEHALSVLNEALTDQQAQITRLEASYQSLLDRIRVLAEETAARDGGERPPHY